MGLRSSYASHYKLYNKPEFLTMKSISKVIDGWAAWMGVSLEETELIVGVNDAGPLVL